MEYWDLEISLKNHDALPIRVARRIFFQNPLFRNVKLTIPYPAGALAVKNGAWDFEILLTKSDVLCVRPFCRIFFENPLGGNV